MRLTVKVVQLRRVAMAAIRVASIGHQNDQAVAENIGRVGSESKGVELVDLLVAQFDTTSHGSLRARVLHRVYLKAVRKLIGSLSVST